MDRSTLKALITKADGLSEDQVDQYLDSAEKFLNRIRSEASEIQEQSGRKTEEATSDAREAVRQWLNRMNRPELRYDRLKYDVRRILDDPKATPSVLKHRLNRMDRQSMIALVSNNSMISREQAERVADQIEQSRNEVLEKVNEIEQTVKNKTAEAKQEALRQIEATRKTAAVAAWWIFVSVVVSGGASVLGGILALSI